MSNNQIIVAGPASQGLAVKIGKLMDAPIISTETKSFPDGENYVRLEVSEDLILFNKEVNIVQTTGGNAYGNQNQRLMELIMMISAAKRMGTKKIRVIVPYLAYSRQDKAFRPGETPFIYDILQWIERAGATEFYTVDIHEPKVFEACKMPCFNLDPMELLAHLIKSFHLSDPVVICPDKGAYERSHTFAKFLGEQVPVQQLQKTRDVQTGSIKMEGNLSVANKTVIIADDIIATGGTMALTIKFAKKAGAKSIYVVGTHPLMIKNATYTLLSAGTTEIIGTDCLDSAYMQVSMAELIVKAIQRIL
jgi:ribose-phosphate pyrophosphokinase